MSPDLLDPEGLEFLRKLNEAEKKREAAYNEQIADYFDARGSGPIGELAADNADRKASQTAKESLAKLKQDEQEFLKRQDQFHDEDVKEITLKLEERRKLHEARRDSSIADAYDNGGREEMKKIRDKVREEHLKQRQSLGERETKNVKTTVHSGDRDNFETDARKAGVESQDKIQLPGSEGKGQEQQLPGQKGEQRLSAADRFAQHDKDRAEREAMRMKPPGMGR